MYRHFAMLTVAVTLAVGVFADGESRKAVASATQPRAIRSQPADLVRHDRRALGTFSSDGTGSGQFGEPMDIAGAKLQDGIIPGNAGPREAAAVPSGFTQYGIDARTWARLTEEQRKALIARRKAELEASETPERLAQARTLLAASRERSGEATPAD